MKIIILVLAVFSFASSLAVRLNAPEPYPLSATITGGEQPPFDVGRGAWILVQSAQPATITPLYGVRLYPPSQVANDRGYLQTAPYKIDDPAAAVLVTAGQETFVLVLQGMRVDLPVIHGRNIPNGGSRRLPNP